MVLVDGMTIASDVRILSRTNQRLISVVWRQKRCEFGSSRSHVEASKHQSLSFSKPFLVLLHSSFPHYAYRLFSPTTKQSFKTNINRDHTKICHLLMKKRNKSFSRKHGAMDNLFFLPLVSFTHGYS